MTNTHIALQRTATDLIQREMVAQNLTGWTFKFSTVKASLGRCNYRKQQIDVSVYVLPQGLKRVLQVAAHEIAHAVVGARHGHDHVWRQKAIELGDTGHRCGRMEVPHSVEGHCPSCETTFKRNRMPNRNSTLSCRKCLHAGKPARVVWERV
jgi:hypothetical protein